MPDHLCDLIYENIEVEMVQELPSCSLPCLKFAAPCQSKKSKKKKSSGCC